MAQITLDAHAAADLAAFLAPRWHDMTTQERYALSDLEEAVRVQTLPTQEIPGQQSLF